MLPRKNIFPHVIEVNVQLGRVLGCNIYLVYDQAEWILIDVGASKTTSKRLLS